MTTPDENCNDNLDDNFDDYLDDNFDDDLNDYPVPTFNSSSN